MSSQQGPVNRPWFRLASMMRPPPPPTTPAPPATTPQPEPVPVPRPAFIRPTFRAPAPAPSQEPTRPPPPQPSVASPPASPLVASPPPPPVASAPPPPPVQSPAPTAPLPRIVAAAQSPRTVATAPSPTVVTPAPTMPSPKVVTPVPTMPSPRIAAAAPPPTVVTSSPQIVAAQPPPSPAAPQVPATNGSSITNSPIKKESFPSFSSPTPKVSSLSSSSPPPKLVSPSPPPPPSPSIVSLASSNGTTATIPRNTTPISSPKIVKQQGKTPPPSPSMKPFTHPPSPLTLPPAQIKSDTMRETRSPPVFEQKTVLVQETREKLKASPKNFKGGQSDSPKHDITKENGNHKKYLESEDFGMRIITIAGENKGATMELSTSRRSNDFGHIKRGSPRSWSDGEKSGSINGNIAKDLNQKAIPMPITAFTNSNVQGVNNSIVYNCSIAHHDPGVHLSLPKKPNGGNGIYLKDRSNGSHN